MNNQRKFQIGDDAMNYFTFLCCWLQKRVIVTPVSHCGTHTHVHTLQLLRNKIRQFPSSLNSVILDRWRCIRVTWPKRQHFYEGMTAVVTTRGLLRQRDFCDKLHLNPCLYSSLHIAPSCIKSHMVIAVLLHISKIIQVWHLNELLVTVSWGDKTQL